MPAKGSSLDEVTFRKLKRLYFLALGAIALSVIVSQIFIHQYLNDQEGDSTVVNIAGRQRMLSQKLTKQALLLSAVDGPQERLALKKEMQATLLLWKDSHDALRNANYSLAISGENSPAIQEMFEQLEPYFLNMVSALDSMLHHLEEHPTLPIGALKDELASLKKNEAFFLEGMDRVVDQYEWEASERVVQLSQLELLLMSITLLLLFCEFIFLFWPMAKTLKKTIGKLLQAEQQARQMAEDADELSKIKEQSVTELRALNRAMNQTLLFARITADGNIIEMGEKFSRLFKFRKIADHSKFYELLSTHDNERIEIEHLLKENATIGWQGELKATTADGVPVWLEMSLIPFNSVNDKWEILVVASDITTRKQAQLEIAKLTEQRFKEKMDQQKLISSKIIENQENEQNRIAKDIHDGIGQMLTGLNFNLESIDIKQTEKASEKIENLKELTGKIIKGVRTATFNLMPPELSDHGVVPALIKLCRELRKLTGENILLYNKTNFNERMDSLIEINIYRITQEAINNAVKYANSTQIIVSISHSSTILSIIVDDNGKGFDPENLKEGKNSDGGMGMTFMKERIKYINGRLFVHSEPLKGTRITFNVPLK